MSTQDEFMRASDAFSWYQESDLAMRATIVTVVWLDRAPGRARLVTRVEGATRLVPRLRQRVAELPVHMAVPRRVTAENFELSWHLRRTSGTTDGAVLEHARIEAMTGFDRARPLWVCTLVEGLGAAHEAAPRARRRCGRGPAGADAVRHRPRARLRAAPG